MGKIPNSEMSEDRRLKRMKNWDSGLDGLGGYWSCHCLCSVCGHSVEFLQFRS